MIYEPNLTHWKKGDVVLHDADAKEPKMLMLVTGRTRDGLIKTKYTHRSHKRSVYQNELKYLHDPKRFGINPIFGRWSQELQDRVQREFERMRRWNNIYKSGADVYLPTLYGVVTTYTTGIAYLSEVGYAVVPIKDADRTVPVSWLRPAYSEEDLEKLRRE